MSYSLTLDFDSYDELCDFITQFKSFKEKQYKKKEKEFIQAYDNLNDNLKDTDKQNDRRGQHQVIYHNLAKQYQNDHPELSYRDSLKFVYKNNKVVEKII